MNKSTIFSILSALTFSGLIFALVTQKISVGYGLLIIGYCLLRKSDKGKEQ